MSYSYLDNGPCNWNSVSNPHSMQFVCQIFVGKTPVYRGR